MTRRPRLGLQPLEDRTTPTVSAIAANFGGGGVPAGQTVWFASAGKVAGLGAGPATLHLTGGTISFTAGGVAHTVAVPDTTITFTQLAAQATTSFSATDGWVVTAPPTFGGNVFLGGVALPVPGGLPGGIKNVTWQTDVTADVPGLTVSWNWGASAYSNFGESGALWVKTVDDKKVDFYPNADKAGTPEAFKAFSAGGVVGSSGTGQVAASPFTPPPPPPPPGGPATLAGTVFLDANGDHEIDPSDFGYGGIQVVLVDGNGAVVNSATTGDDGTFAFTEVDAGTYSVLMDLTGLPFNTMFPQVGTSGGEVDPSWAGINGIQLAEGAEATGYNLGVWESPS